MIVVADASPLIALARIERLDLLRALFGTLLLPEAVWREVVAVGLDRAGAAAVMSAKISPINAFRSTVLFFKSASEHLISPPSEIGRAAV